MLNTVIFLLAILLIGLSVSWVVAGKLVAPAFREVSAPAGLSISLKLEDITIKSESGSQLVGWHAQHESSKGVVILFHGIRGSREAMLSRAQFLFNDGYSVVLIDFQAHGQSTGSNITVGYLEKHDVMATLKFVKQKYPHQAIAVLGSSMGGAAAILNAPLAINALIVESVYPSLRAAIINRVSARLGVFAWLPATLLLAQLKPRIGISIENLRPIDLVGAVNCPIYIISGKQDVYTTVSETQAIYNAAKHPKQLWLVDGVAHQDIYNHASTIYEKNILRFLSTHMK